MRTAFKNIMATVLTAAFLISCNSLKVSADSNTDTVTKMNQLGDKETVILTPDSRIFDSSSSSKAPYMDTDTSQGAYKPDNYRTLKLSFRAEASFESVISYTWYYSPNSDFANAVELYSSSAVGTLSKDYGGGPDYYFYTCPYTADDFYAGTY